MEPFVLVPIVIGAVFVVLIGTIAYRAIIGFAEWSRNNSLPVLETRPHRGQAE